MNAVFHFQRKAALNTGNAAGGSMLVNNRSIG